MRLTAADVAPYLGDHGGVPPWRLTQAIEDGDVATALTVLRWLLSATGPQQPKPMHPLQVLAMLHNHYRRVARLDDPAIQSRSDAVAALGGRVREFQAEKAWKLSRALGPDGIRAAYDHLAQADLDLKGTRAIPEDAVMEVLVARLAALSGRSGARPGRRPARGRRG
jgi:DNA polymerase-3 subunit delta